MLHRMSKILSTVCATALAVTAACAAAPGATASPVHSTAQSPEVAVTQPTEPSPTVESSLSVESSGAALGESMPGFHHVAPTRVHDSRTADAGRLTTRRSRTVSLAELVNTMTDNVTAATVTVTAVEPAADGYLTVWPFGKERPGISTLNYAAGENTASTVTIALGEDDTISVYSHADTHLLVDVIGFVDDTSPFKPVPGHRVLDTRNTNEAPTADRFLVEFAGLEDRPDEGVQGVTINVTVIEPDTAGTLHAWAMGTNKPIEPAASYPSGRITSTTMLVPMGFEDTIEIANSTPGHLVVDVLGWVARDETFSVHPATALYDSTDPAGCEAPTTGRTHTVTATPRGNCTAPPATGSAWVSVTVTGDDSPGYATVTGTTDDASATSTILYQPHVSRTALIPVRLDGTGRFQVYTHTDADVTASLVAHGS